MKRFSRLAPEEIVAAAMVLLVLALVALRPSAVTDLFASPYATPHPEGGAALALTAPPATPSAAAATAVAVTASPTPTPEPTPTPLAPSARPITAASDAFVLVPLRWSDISRLWSVDPRLERTSELVVKWTPPSEVGPWVAYSADRSRAVISAVAPSGFAALYLIELRTGTVRPLVVDASADLIGPVIDRRGAVVAYTRRSRAQLAPDDGVWVAEVAGGAPRKLVAAASSVPQALGWSSDAAWLAFTTVGFPHIAARMPVHVISADGLRRIDTRLDGGIDWHPTQPRLLVTRSAHPSDARDSVVSSYEVPSGAVAPLYRPPEAQRWLSRARWSPKGDAFVVLEGEYDRVAGDADVLMVGGGGTATRVARAAFITDMFWSPAGDLLLVIGGNDSAVGIRNVTTGKSSFLCLRTDDPVRCP